MGDKCGAHSHREDGPAYTGPTPWSDGKRYWRSLDELSGTGEFLDKLQREFPRFASERTDGASRRDFLKVMGASLALAGAAGCFRRPEQEAAPYVDQPDLITPGNPLYFSTVLPINGYGRGVIVTSHEGKPTKVEGNPAHPSSLGSADAITQAAVLDLYDPGRSQNVKCLGVDSSWDRFITEPQMGARPFLDKFKSNGGKGLFILGESSTSPTLGDVLGKLFKALPNAKWYRHDPIGRANSREGIKKANDQVQPIYSLDKAKVIVSLDSNFLADEPGSIAYARQFTDGRRVRADRPEMNRLYAIEGAFTMTGAMADHRLAVKPSRIQAIATALAASLGTGATTQPSAGALTADETTFTAALADDLKANQGASAVLCGESQPPVVHAIALTINQILANFGKTVNLIPSPEITPATPNDSLADLAQQLDSGNVDMLLILGANPCYTAPAEVDFQKSLKAFSEAPGTDGRPRYLSVRHGQFNDETSAWCQWHLPATHPLEEWGDLRAHDGTASIMQPLIEPLYQGRSTLELIAWLTTYLTVQTDASAQATDRISPQSLVQTYWRNQWKGNENDFQIWWETCLDQGVIPATAFAPVDASAVALPTNAVAPADTGGIEAIFLPDPSIWDGRYANNGWLQELPKPISKITWDNAVFLGRQTADALGVTNNDVVTLTLGDRTITSDQCAVWVLPGLANDTALIYLGYGRPRTSEFDDALGVNLGFNAYAIRTSDARFFAPGLQIAKTGKTYHLATTQGNQVMDGRDLLRIGTVEYAFEKNPEDDKDDADEVAILNGGTDVSEATKSYNRVPLSLYPATPDHADGKQLDPQWQAWGMVIDANACIGCNACIVACQSENNISVVGKDQVLRGREMHWLRIDTYFEGPVDAKGIPTESAPNEAQLDATNRGATFFDVGVGPGQAGAYLDKGELKPYDPSDVHAYFQPIPCMQCEKAPCEVVCPVGATLHDVEGINNMVYNRCVGTRYCSNNCPYKVRRFNFYQYADLDHKSLALGHNPEVTIRNRGVMEKCTYCVQRLSTARIEAKRNGNYTADDKPLIPDGSVLTACQQTCPTQAIFFGDINDPASVVVKMKNEPLNYALLEDLQTKPRTSYLWRLNNPNPALIKGGAVG